MSKREEKFKELIKEGKWNFVFKYGLGWGAFMFLFILFYDKIIENYSWDLLDTLFHFILLGILGLIAGLWGWSRINKKLKRKEIKLK